MPSAITPRIDFKTELAGLWKIDGQVAFVPGGYGGIGEAVCWGLALAGATPIVAGRHGESATRLAQAIRAAGLNADACAVDTTNIEAARAAVDEAARRHGRLDVLANCVGIQIEQPLLDVTEDAFDTVYRANLKAAMFLAQACAQRQIEGKRGGAQVHLLSVRSQLGLRGRGYSAYCATKGALVMLIRQHAAELAPHGIRVNGVAPTVVATEMARHWLENETTRKQLFERIPLGRVADPKDVVGAVLFFCAPAAAFVTGQILYIDGGITATQ
ncbi:MAG TPA: SDR family oxidoreductase [Burkholderiaceae bacterium]|nr:SDR family oxidoreductase [Burkholderiaceae bacterium]